MKYKMNAFYGPMPEDKDGMVSVEEYTTYESLEDVINLFEAWMQDDNIESVTVTKLE